jgi:hypothetical protein
MRPNRDSNGRQGFSGDQLNCIPAGTICCRMTPNNNMSAAKPEVDVSVREEEAESIILTQRLAARFRGCRPTTDRVGC